MKFKQNLLSAILLIAALALTIIAITDNLKAAGSSSPFTYQGRLTDNNAVANGLFDLEFILYDDPVTDANQIGPIVQINAVNVNHGTFTVELDFGANAFLTTPRWLQIAVRPGNQLPTPPYVDLSPRQKITPPPYTHNNGSANGDLLTWNGAYWFAQQPAIQHFTINNMQPVLAVNYIIALEGDWPYSGQTPGPMIGEIRMFAGNVVPDGWAFCDGQLLSINQYQSLYSILTTNYGGDGRTNFALPDLRGRAPIHEGTGPGLTKRNLGSKTGTENTSR